MNSLSINSQNSKKRIYLLNLLCVMVPIILIIYIFYQSIYGNILWNYHSKEADKLYLSYLIRSLQLVSFCSFSIIPFFIFQLYTSIQQLPNTVKYSYTFINTCLFSIFDSVLFIIYAYAIGHGTSLLGIFFIMLYFLCFLIILYSCMFFTLYNIRNSLYKKHISLKRDKKFVYMFLSVLFVMYGFNLSAAIYHDIQKNKAYSEIVEIKNSNMPINKQLISIFDKVKYLNLFKFGTRSYFPDLNSPNHIAYIKIKNKNLPLKEIEYIKIGWPCVYTSPDEVTYEFYSKNINDEIVDIVYNPKLDKIIHNESTQLNNQQAKDLIYTINHEIFNQLLNELKP